VRSPCSDIVCAYCGQPGANERDHVIAKQFFPPNQLYRGNLPQVPSCGACNRRKQRVEDGPAVLF
jgi:5-methylcytosine-specific restriction endonuclease McrA